MRRVKQVKVSKLFGYMNHDIKFRGGEPTILTAPNGAGKTHVLMLIRAALQLDVRSLIALPFAKLEIFSDDNSKLVIQRSAEATRDRQLTFRVYHSNKATGKPAVLGEKDFDDDDPRIPPYIHRMPDGRWYDDRSERVFSSQHIERRYDVKLNETGDSRFAGHPDLKLFVSDMDPILIDTKRLDVAYSSASPFRTHIDVSDKRNARQYQNENMPTLSPIRQYTDQIRKQVNEARRKSVLATQRADVSFAKRALDAAQDKVDRVKLQQRYSGVVEKYEDLTSNGLAVGDAPIEFPDDMTLTVRRILNVFLNDWEERLDPLLPLNEKLRTLRQILDSKLEKSGKETVMGTGGTLGFRPIGQERRILVGNLSSGEQHLVALFTLLLFGAKQGSIVMIDEPEISMHAAWKHAFLADISRVARLADLQIIIATHSTSIINGRWELTEELKFTPLPKVDLSENGDFGPEADDLID